MAGEAVTVAMKHKVSGVVMMAVAVLSMSIIVERAGAGGLPGSAVFSVTPPSGPVGTEVRIASVTPCAVPLSPGAAVRVAVQLYATFSDAVPAPLVLSFAVGPDGSWSGVFPAENYDSGPVRIEASCATDGGPPVIYANQHFRQTPAGRGYWLATATEVDIPCFCPPPGPPTNIRTFGDAAYEGSPADFSTAVPLVGMAATPVEGLGYWLVASNGGVFSFGDAPFFGSAALMPLRRPIVGIVATPTGRGYWLVASDGGVFAFGDATFHGSTGGTPLSKPIAGMAATPTGGGYWLVASDGGVFAFGEAGFHGSAAGRHLNRPVVGMAATPTGGGYWLVAADGGIFSFGDAAFHGSTGATRLNRPVVGMAASPGGRGYWLLGADGGVFTFGDATFHGSCSGCWPQRDQTRFIAMSATPITRPG